MKKLIIFLIFCFLGWQVYTKYQNYSPTTVSSQQVEVFSNKPKPSPSTQKKPSPSSAFKCDGRIYCSQMTSCAEATFFLKNCPNVKMDGNNDGVPCEKQWCNGN